MHPDFLGIVVTLALICGTMLFIVLAIGLILDLKGPGRKHCKHFWTPQRSVAPYPTGWCVYCPRCRTSLEHGRSLTHTKQTCRDLSAEQLPTAAPGVCEECGYDLSGNESGICPECGTAFRDLARKG